MTTPSSASPGKFLINGEPLRADGYLAYHGRRVSLTLEKLAALGSKRVVEIGAHPWVMTSRIVADPRFRLVATVSAEEVSSWPDEIPLRRGEYRIDTPNGRSSTFTNYSANVERTLFDIAEPADTVLASEIVEHLIRSPHVMFLNANRWLPIGGHLLVTTPNGAQFANPFRRRSPTPAYRASVYERHTYLYVLDDLVDLVELCGFRVVERGYWDVVSRQGISLAYDLLSRIPLAYFASKFKKTLFVIARKVDEMERLPHPPRVYDPRGTWEFVTPARS